MQKKGTETTHLGLTVERTIKKKKKSVWGEAKKNKVLEDDLMESYPYQMTNFEIKAVLNVNRPLKVLYSKETHNPLEKDIQQHATCSA